MSTVQNKTSPGMKNRNEDKKKWYWVFLVYKTTLDLSTFLFAYFIKIQFQTKIAFMHLKNLPFTLFKFLSFPVIFVLPKLKHKHNAIPTFKII